MRKFSFKYSIYTMFLFTGIILAAGLCCPAGVLAQSSKNMEAKTSLTPPATPTTISEANASALTGDNSTLKDSAPNVLVHSVKPSQNDGQSTSSGNLYPVTGGNASRLNATSLGEADAYFQKEGDDAAFSWSGYFMAIGALLFVLGLLWLVVWALRKRGALPGMARLGRNSFKVEASLPLGPKKNLVLVRFLNSRFLLGVTDHQITLIKEVEGQDAHGKPNTDNASDFSELLRQASQKNDKPDSN